MSAETLLSMLDKVRKTGPDRYIARCPSHDDKSPSLTIRESDDGKVLVHCFAGCSVHEIVHAVGLELSDLFPPRQTYGKPQHRAFSAADALRRKVSIEKYRSARNQFLEDVAKRMGGALLCISLGGEE